MVIDVHVHPAFYGPICEDPQRVDTRKKVMGYDLMSPFPLELVEKQMAFAGVDKLVLLYLFFSSSFLRYFIKLIFIYQSKVICLTF